MLHIACIGCTAAYCFFYMFHDLLVLRVFVYGALPARAIHRLGVFHLPTQERLDLQKRLEAQSNEVRRATFVHSGTRCSYWHDESFAAMCA